MNALQRLDRAKVNLIIDHPFFGTLACRLPFELTEERPTMAVTTNKIYANPNWVTAQDERVLEAGVAHEVMHIVLDHLTRCSDRNPRKWNAAGDYAINLRLKACGMTLGKGWLLDPKFDGMTADHIYNLLPDDPSGPTSFDEIVPSEGSPEDMENERAIWKEAVQEAAVAAHVQGKLPDDLKRFIDELLGNRVDWRAALWRFAQERAKNDFSWLRPNRRLMAQRIILPSLYSENMGTVAIVVDTSGSIDDVILKAFGGEIAAICESVRPQRTVVMYCDAQVHRVDEFTEDQPVELHAVGGGGTDFRPPFRWIDKHQVDPACLIYLTDMYGTFPDEEAPYPVLWVATSDVVAPWGETVPIKL